MESIYSDNHLLALIKPPGIPSQPTFHEMARDWVKKIYQKPGNVFLEPMHRLDKSAQGILLFARTSKALSRLNEALRLKQIKKTYLAYVEGHLSLEESTLQHYLYHDEFHAKVVAKMHPGAKNAILSYRVIKKNEKVSLLQIFLHTGRYHQIRAQLSHIGHPVLGDTKYGSSVYWKKGGIALCHTELELIHPVTKKQLIFHYDCEAFS